LLATVRSRCRRAVWPAAQPASWLGPDASEAARELVVRLEALAGAEIPEVLDFAEDFRGARAEAAAAAEELLATASAWLHARTTAAARAGGRDLRPLLDAFRTLARCRQSLAQRNANPQMVAERALFALREATSR
jgi:hypothetical protein